MTVSTRTELISAVATGEVDAILGTRESEWLDFKEKVHNLVSPKGRRDLVADCAAFANHVGGVILFGVREKREEQLNAAIAESIHPVKRVAVNEDRIHDLLRANARPLLRVEFAWSPGGDEGVFAIIVPPQPEFLKPFLVARMADQNDSDLPHAFGWPIRHGTGTHWETVDRTQLLLADGLRHKAQVDRTSASTAADQRAVQAISQRDALSGRADWQQWPLYIVSAVPNASPDVRIEDFHGAFYQDIQQWAGARSGGFDLGLNDGQTRLEEDEIFTSDYRSAVYLSRSGVVTAAAVGSPEMLGWASHAPGDAKLEYVNVNPYAIVEFTYETIRVAYQAVAPQLHTRAGWTLTAMGLRLEGDGARPGLRLRTNVEPRTAMIRPHPPITDHFEATAATTDEDLEGDTYLLLAEALGKGWGLRHDQIPFAKDGCISAETIAAATKG